SAMLHGAIFVLALLAFGRVSSLSGVLTIFVTPFGMVFTLAFFQTLLYWATLIGICNYMTRSVARELSGGTWNLLRLTPYSVAEILLAKLAVVCRMWGCATRTLVTVRAVLLVIALGAMLMPYVQHNGEAPPPLQLQVNLTLATVFLLEPVIDVLVMASLSIFSAMLIRHTTWSLVGAYAFGALTFGGIGFLNGLWMLIRSPMGFLAGLLIPLGHWGPLFATITPASSSDEMVQRATLYVAIYVLLPVAIAGLALWQATKWGRQIA
ncbi:MAG TPA: hypothetical protein VMT34_13185, partial [Aggregatilineales bacterium]|nr:hypothetical protein [Aggregatilineales bacterium]